MIDSQILLTHFNTSQIDAFQPQPDWHISTHVQCTNFKTSQTDPTFNTSPTDTFQHKPTHFCFVSPQRCQFWGLPSVPAEVFTLEVSIPFQHSRIFQHCQTPTFLTSVFQQKITFYFQPMQYIQVIRFVHLIKSVIGFLTIKNNEFRDFHNCVL